MKANLIIRERNRKLMDRLTGFSKKTISLCQRLPKIQVNRHIIDQVIPSGTSMGANYNEACEAESSRDFVHKINICKKESRETKYWFQLLESIKENERYLDEIRNLYSEADEFLRIFSSIVSKFKIK